MQIMDRKEFELIRQAEMANLTPEEEEELKNWVETSTLSSMVISDIFGGNREIAGIENGDPIIRFTKKGEQRWEEKYGDNDNDDNNEEFCDDCEFE